MKEKMTFGQLVDILGMLSKTLFNREVEWDSVSCETAQAIIKGDRNSFANQFVQFLANGSTVIVGGLLKRIAAVKVSGTARFVAAEHLKEANVGYMGDNFKKFFLNKAEENVPDAKLVVSRLEKASPDVPILAELGDEAETKLAYLFNLLKKQANGEDGALLTNDYMNIFYVRDADGNLWAVSAGWGSGRRYWFLDAGSVGDPGGWNDGRQVFSRDSWFSVALRL